MLESRQTPTALSPTLRLTELSNQKQGADDKIQFSGVLSTVPETGGPIFGPFVTHPVFLNVFVIWSPSRAHRKHCLLLFVSVNDSLKVALYVSPDHRFIDRFVPSGVSDMQSCPAAPQQRLHLAVWRTLLFAQGLDSIVMLGWWNKLVTVTFVCEHFSRVSIFCGGSMGWRALTTLTGLRVSSGHHRKPPHPLDMPEEPMGDGLVQQRRHHPCVLLLVSWDVPLVQGLCQPHSWLRLGAEDTEPCVTGRCDHPPPGSCCVQHSSCPWQLQETTGLILFLLSSRGKGNKA